MRTYCAVFILAALTSFTLTPWVRRLAIHLRAIDHPSERKIHSSPMPRLGGLAIFAGFCFPWAGFYLLENRVTTTFYQYETLFFALLLAGFAMLLLGVYDDLKGANAPKKLMVQIAVAIGLYFAGFKMTVLTNPLGEPFQLGWLSLPISVLWIVGITNAINLLDGIDGLVAGMTACIAFALALINILAGNIIVALLTLCLAGACLGFLPYNFSPARIFLGDTGSLFLGLALACIAMLSMFKGTTAGLLAAPLVLFALPVYDTISVLVTRLQAGKPLFQADKSHIHHRLLQLGLNQKETAFALYGLTALLCALAVCLNLQQTPQIILLIFALALAVPAYLALVSRARSRGSRTNSIPSATSCEKAEQNHLSHTEPALRK